MKRTWTILVDEREKKPLPLPSSLCVWDPASVATNPRTVMIDVKSRKTRLPTGDYLLECSPSRCIIERKGSLDELQNNLCTPPGRRKFVAELVRLNQECSHPVIFLEGDPLSLQNTRRLQTNPHVVRDTLLHICFEYNVQLYLLPSASSSSRRAAGEWLTALLIAGAHHDRRPQEDLRSLADGRPEQGHLPGLPLEPALRPPQ